MVFISGMMMILGKNNYIVHHDNKITKLIVF